MSFEVRRGEGAQAPGADVLLEGLNEAWKEAEDHIRLDRYGVSCTVYIGAEREVDPTTNDGDALLLAAADVGDMERLFMVFPAGEPGRWSVAWRTASEDLTVELGQTPGEVQNAFRRCLFHLKLEARAARQQAIRKRKLTNAPVPVPDDRFVLFLSNMSPEAATNRLKALEVRWMRKRLDSSPENWETILPLLTSSSLICVVGRLNRVIFDKIAAPEFEPVRRALFKALAGVPHILFVHENLLSGDVAEPRPEDDDPDAYDYPSSEREFFGYLRVNGFFENPTEDVRTAVIRFFEENKVNVVPYLTAAEYSVMADSFIADNERDLLFRIYVPTGRLFAGEADKLLSLFRDWLGRVRGQGVRQDGYETPAGHMYEFYGDGKARSVTLQQDFRDFSEFLDLCMEHPDRARDHLKELGFESGASTSLVTRYAKEARRLQLDIKQEREQRVLAIQHRVESEVLEESIANGEVSAEAVNHLINSLVPAPGAQFAGVLEAASLTAAQVPVQVQINQQIVNTIEGTVIQSVQGTVNLGPEAQELLELIGRFAGAEQGELQSAVYELEDPDARKEDRLGAKQRLKGFLAKVGSGLQDIAVAALVKYLDTKLGL